MHTNYREKVLWLINGLGAGGAEMLLVDALPYIDRNTFDYEVAYLRSEKDDLVPHFERAGIPVFCLGNAYSLATLPKLVRLLKKRRVTLLHSHLPYAGIMGRLGGRVAGVKAHIYTEHNVLDAYNSKLALLDRLTYWMDHATIAVSRPVETSVMNWPILRPKSLQTIENGVSMSWLGIPESAADIKRSLGIPQQHRIIGNVAHIRPEKGHSYLLQAIGEVVKQKPDASCVIIGREKIPGTLETLQQQAIDLGIRDHIIFTGFREDARRLMHSFDVFVLSSFYEGLPVALLEAMALGTPPVVTAVGGVPSVVEDGVDGFLVQPRDPHTLADRILKVLDNPDCHQALAQAAARKVRERFGMERMVREVEGIYRRVLKLAPEPTTSNAATLA